MNICQNLVFIFFFSSYLKSFWKYDYVIFNHHQTFLFSLLFKGPKYLIVHDLISVKNLDSQKKNSKAVANFIESIVFRKSFLIFLSVDEKNHTFAKYEYKSSFLLDLYSHPKELYPWDGINIVLIGNYKRKENIISVENFFELFFNKVKRYELTSNFIFSIVGFGADSLISSPSINRYKDSIRLVNNYTNISEYKGSLHVSPLIRGAGLKIKLIEAYGAGIFTLGTKYTFQGVHQFLLSEMGVCANSIDDLVDILLFRREILYHPINIKVPIPNDLMKIEQILNKNEIR